MQPPQSSTVWVFFLFEWFNANRPQKKIELIIVNLYKWSAVANIFAERFVKQLVMF